jgi:hypothetical protein
MKSKLINSNLPFTQNIYIYILVFQKTLNYYYFFNFSANLNIFLRKKKYIVLLFLPTNYFDKWIWSYFMSAMLFAKKSPILSFGDWT